MAAWTLMHQGTDREAELQHLHPDKLARDPNKSGLRSCVGGDSRLDCKLCGDHAVEDVEFHREFHWRMQIPSPKLRASPGWGGGQVRGAMGNFRGFDGRHGENKRQIGKSPQHPAVSCRSFPAPQDASAYLFFLSFEVNRP